MLLAQIATQLGSIRRVVVSRHYHGEWTFLPLWVRHRYHGGFTDAGMSDNRVLQVHRANPLAAGLHQVFGAVGDLHVAFGIDGDDVAGAEPSIVGPFVAL